MKEALWWKSLGHGKVKCELCPNACVILPGKQGVCQVRENREGRLYSVNYGQVASIGLDPIEKKPLFHFHPGALVLSLGTYGCNLMCTFCQNWQISQMRPSCTVLTPRQAVDMCLSQKRRHPGIIGMAYTYNEPTVWYEFVKECAKEAGTEGFANVLVTNGYIAEEALGELLPLIDAMNIDVKAWDEGFYRRIARGKLDPVLKTVKQAFDSGTWIEITYLVVPGENDKDEDIEGLAKWLSNIDPGIPLHLSRYFPAYKHDKPPTPLASLERLRAVAGEKLEYVYVGNAWKKGYADTLCPQCREPLLERGALELERVNLCQGACPRCSRKSDIVGTVWM
ncbi:MAG TPA: AmmeMemoRadiSam system radical SAM enzyme [Firmicutes bacterium]|nr:AmmeMemoRadiSam system radical SAM enzyme [Candidatus Fermentithermobacillaceae bacterium]